MDNEAPKYASWIPQAGGYVANGNVVSKSPIYDEQGKLKLDVDTSVFTQAQPQTANTTQGNNGITTANITGSGTDANAMTTSIGSGASLNLNTENPDESVLSTPATKSPIAQEPILSPEDRAMKNIQDAAGRNDLQGMINGYIELSEANGQDYSTTIEGLTKQREQKITSIDDQYIARYQEALARYNEAKRAGDLEGTLKAQLEMNQIKREQEAWREQVGYEDAMESARRRQEEELILKWQDDYLKGIDEITNTILQLTGNYLNFQYNPMQDQNLLRAQSLVEMRARNRASATGMYYSTTTQYAISQAEAELIPIYEKMAKEEVLQQLNILQSTANYLMNLEQTQFNIWRGQIELQWEANQEKRRQWQQALDASNARGYVNNQEAAILDVEPGSMSQAAREHAQALQEKIDEEERTLEQQKKLADYKYKLDRAQMQEQKRLNVQEYREKKNIDREDATSRNPLTFNELLGTLESAFEAGYSDNEVAKIALEMAETAEDAEAAYLRAKTSSNTANEKKQQEEDAKDAAYTNLTDTATKNIKSHKIKAKLNKVLEEGYDKEKYIHTIDEWVSSGASASDLQAAIDEMAKQNFGYVLEKSNSKYGKDYKETKQALDEVRAAAKEFGQMLYASKYKDKEAKIAQIYENVLAGIHNVPFFDYSWGDVFDTELEQKTAELEVLEDIKKYYGGERTDIYETVWDFRNHGYNNDQSLLEDMENVNTIIKALYASRMEEVLGLNKTEKGE